MENDMRKIHRSTSMLLRKQRDQAKKDFLQDRRSGQFLVDNRYDDFAFVSLNESSNMAWKQRADPKVEGPRSLGYLPAQQSKRFDMKGKENEEKRESNLWRKTDAGHRKDDRTRKTASKDLKLFHNQQHLDHQTEKYKNDRYMDGLGREDIYGYVDMNMQDQPFSLPVTLDEFERRNDSISLLKGMLWQKKDRIFSRWKERFFMLTSDYLNCYEKNPQSSADASLFKIKLSSIACMDLTEKKGYLTIALTVHKEGKILLRSTNGIQEWFHVITRCCKKELEQRTENCWSMKGQVESDNIERWLLGRTGLGNYSSHHTSTPNMAPYNQIMTEHTISQHNIGSIDNIRDQIDVKPKKRSNSQRYSRRPKSFIESSTPWHVQNRPKERQMKKQQSTDQKREDSGNSSMSTHTDGSRRQDMGYGGFRQRNVWN